MTDHETRRSFIVRATITAMGVVVGCGDDSLPAGESDDGSSADSSSTSAPQGNTSTSGTGAETTSVGADEASSSTAPADESGSTSTGESSDSSGTGNMCEPSAADIEGPFYRPGIPIGGDLDVHGDLGDPLVLSGQVLDTECQPLRAAIVEIWHATPVLPDGAPGDVNATYDDTPQYRYYGQVATDAEGRYEFTTLRPGWYLNGAAYRPAHLHIKVWVRGQERLTTQLYFVDDPFNDDDPWFNPDMAIDPDPAGAASIDFVVT